MFSKFTWATLALALIGCGGSVDGNPVSHEPIEVGAEAAPVIPPAPVQVGPVGGALPFGQSVRWMQCPHDTRVITGNCSGGALVTVISQGIDPEYDAWSCTFVVASPAPGASWSYADQEADVVAYCE